MTLIFIIHECFSVILYLSTSETIHLEAAFVFASCKADRVHSSHPPSFLCLHKVAIVLSFNTGSVTWDMLSKLCPRSRSPCVLSVSLPKMLHPFPISCIFTFPPSPPPPTHSPLLSNTTFCFHPPCIPPPYLSAVCLPHCLMPSPSLPSTKLCISKEHIPL